MRKKLKNVIKSDIIKNDIEFKTWSKKKKKLKAKDIETKKTKHRKKKT